MTIRVTAASAVVAVLTLGACGTTYVDESIEVVDPSVVTTTTTLPPVDPGAPVERLLAEIEERMFDLDERIIEQDDPEQQLDRILDLWRAAEAQIRRADPDDVYNFAQAIELARSGVERTRPADASKGYKIIRDVIEAYVG